MKNHVTFLGTAYIAFYALGVVVAAVIFFVFWGSGVLSGDEEAIFILNTIGSIITYFLVITALPGIIAGIGLLKLYPWARMLALVLGFVQLLNIPFGTVLGIYTLWVLMKDETVALFNQVNP